jgi:hypothetical protein
MGLLAVPRQLGGWLVTSKAALDRVEMALQAPDT